MRAIDAYELKRSLAVSALIEDQKTLEQIIDEQPTIERKKGKWITTRTWEHDGEIYCDQCGNDAPTEGDYRQVKTNFCPQCGADMRGEDRETDLRRRT